MKPTALRSWVTLLSLVCAAFALFGCGKQDCSNGECLCEGGARCEFTCDAPPCHVTCEGNNPLCEGTCGNATCTCGEGSSCDFSCHSGPCHVDCQGDNSSCSGTCANGTCTCGPGSDCAFDCLDDNCKFNCEGSCVVKCASGEAGSSCQVNRCDAGEPTVCPDGVHVVCGRDCPPPPETSPGE